MKKYDPIITSIFNNIIVTLEEAEQMRDKFFKTWA
jgi:hypothetical protein